jgi:hypothetical protein
MPVSICPFSFSFKDIENFYLFTNTIDLLQGILGFCFYLNFVNNFSSGLLMVWYQVFFIISAFAIYTIYKLHKTFLTYSHLFYFVFKTISLLLYFFIFAYNILELDFDLKNKKNASTVSLLILALIFNIFHFSWHFKLTTAWFSFFKVTRSYSPQETHEENLLISHRESNLKLKQGEDEEVIRED